MEAHLLEWLNLTIRWVHVIVGIAWIGASFYFVWLENNLDRQVKNQELAGELWAIHGGGIYHLQKYKLAPTTMPKQLHWFKWEAYTTWLTGAAMMSIVYYANATAYLIDPSKVPFTSIGAIATSLLFLFGSYFIYEVIVRSHLGKNAFIFSTLIFILLVIASWGSYQLFSDRASFIHIGAILGTVMVGNVFFGIMPAQRALVDCVRRGEKPGKEVAELALQAKNRSLMNNYFTLPLIFTMISNHYPMMYAHEKGWLVLVFVGIITATARHYFNQKHLGHKKPRYLVIPAVLTVLLIIWMRPEPIEPVPAMPATASVAPTTTDSTPPVTSATTDSSTDTVANANNSSNSNATNSANNRISTNAATAEAVPVSASADDAMMDVVHTRCSTCHAVQPTQQGFAAPPAGIILQTPEDLKIYKAKIVTAVQTGYMPLGNITQLTDAERQQLVAYASSL